MVCAWGNICIITAHLYARKMTSSDNSGTFCTKPSHTMCSFNSCPSVYSEHFTCLPLTLQPYEAFSKQPATTSLLQDPFV